MRAGGGGVSGANSILVKVCGLTTLEDATVALECGADWLGFIVQAGGPREIGPDRMQRIVSALPPGTTVVAVLASVTPAEALVLAQRSGATRLQLHRCDPAAWPADYPLPCAFVTPVDAVGRALAPLAPEPHLPQLDAADERMSGGTGRTIPWAAARALASGRRYVLAGGLDGRNVAEAIATARPWGVDASSRLERSPGTKDGVRVRAFVAAAKAAPTPIED
jgi:phosphoribosylanthranilate isomerase